jgi:DNA-binding beta-propeller fold protein YncE
VVRLSHDGKYLGAWGKKGAGEGEFNLPHSIAVDAKGRVYVADRENGRVQVFTGEGKFLAQWREVGHPYGLFLAREGTLYVADGIANTISIYDLEGKRLARWGGPGHQPGQLDLAHLLCVDDQGAVYVTEINGKRVQKFVPE